MKVSLHSRKVPKPRLRPLGDGWVCELRCYNRLFSDYGDTAEEATLNALLLVWANTVERIQESMS